MCVRVHVYTLVGLSLSRRETGDHRAGRRSVLRRKRRPGIHDFSQARVVHFPRTLTLGSLTELLVYLKFRDPVEPRHQLLTY